MCAEPERKEKTMLTLYKIYDYLMRHDSSAAKRMVDAVKNMAKRVVFQPPSWHTMYLKYKKFLYICRPISTQGKKVRLFELQIQLKE